MISIISVRHLSKYPSLKGKVEFSFLCLWVVTPFVYLMFRRIKPCPWSMRFLFACLVVVVLYSLVEVVFFNRLFWGRLCFWVFSLGGLFFVIGFVKNYLAHDITFVDVSLWMSILMRTLLGMAVIYRTCLGLEQKRGVKGILWPRKIFEHEIEFLFLALHMLFWIIWFFNLFEVIRGILYVSLGVVFFLLLQVVFLHSLFWAKVAFVLSVIKLCGFILIAILLSFGGWFIQAWEGGSLDFLPLFAGMFLLGEEVVFLLVVEGTCLRIEGKWN